MQRQQLSSSGTLLYKLIPVAWLIYGLWSLYACLLGLDTSREPLKYVLFFIFWLIGLIVAYLKFGSLKKVFIGDHQLYVSNYLRVTQFPTHEINDITVTSFLSLSSKKITITLKNYKAYPKYIEFIPIKGIAKQIINQIETDITKGNFSLN